MHFVQIGRVFRIDREGFVPARQQCVPEKPDAPSDCMTPMRMNPSSSPIMIGRTRSRSCCEVDAQDRNGAKLIELSLEVSLHVRAQRLHVGLVQLVNEKSFVLIEDPRRQIQVQGDRQDHHRAQHHQDLRIELIFSKEAVISFSNYFEDLSPLCHNPHRRQKNRVPASTGSRFRSLVAACSHLLFCS